MKPPHRVVKRSSPKEMPIEDDSMGFKVIGDFCVDKMSCWPLKVFLVLICVIQVLTAGTFVYLTSKLYSQGMRSKKFYRGGGYHLIITGILGMGAGVATSIMIEAPKYQFILITTSSMVFLMSIFLAGFRGLFAGILGAVPGTIAIWSMYDNQNCQLYGGVAGFVLGIIVGGPTIAYKLDSIERYINSQYVVLSESEVQRLSSIDISDGEP